MKNKIDSKRHYKIVIQGVVAILSLLALIYFLFFVLSTQKEKQQQVIQNSIEAEQLSKQEILKENAKYLISINEVHNSGDKESWLEVYNSSDFPISLAGYTLQNNVRGTSFEFTEEMTIEAREYLVINIMDTEEVMSSNEFSISFDGTDYLELRDLSNELIDFLQIPLISDNESYSKINNDYSYNFTTASKGIANESAEIILKPYPVVNIPSGFYDKEIAIEIIVEDGLDVYYTLDGSNPNQSSLKYTGMVEIGDASQNSNVFSNRTDISIDKSIAPLNKIDKANILKVVAIDKAGVSSKIITNSYFIGYQNKKGYSNIPVISIVTEPENLFDYWNGLYVLGNAYDNRILKNLDTELLESNSKDETVDYANYWLDLKKEGYFQLFEKDGRATYSGEVEISTYNDQKLDFSQKSFYLSKVNMTSMGENTLNYVKYSKDNNAEFILSNGRNDYFVKVRDNIIQKLLSNREIMTREVVPCNVFLDGEYWGVYNLMEPYNSKNIGGKFDIDDENVSVIENNITFDEETGALKLLNSDNDGNESAKVSYLQMINYIAGADTSTEEVYSEISKMMDIESFIECYSTMIYTGNSEWLNSKQLVWKSNKISTLPYEDGRWRWVLNDSDKSLGIDLISGYRMNSFLRPSLEKDILFSQLIKNESFKKHFVMTFFDIANENFSDVNVAEVLGEYSTLYEDPMLKFYDRFLSVRDEKSFENNISQVKSFFEYRMNYMSVYLADKFDLRGTYKKITIINENLDSCEIRLNDSLDISFSEDGEWVAYYYTDYPITLTVKPKSGYIFMGWADGKGTISDSSEKLVIDFKSNNFEWKPMFEKK